MGHLEFLQSLAASGGSWVIYLLLGFSILSAGVILERIVVIFRQERYQKEILPQLDQKLDSQQPKTILEVLKPESVLYPVLEDLIKHASRGRDILNERLETRLTLQKRRLEKRVLILGTLGNNAPFIGLLGTVLGVIHAFQSLDTSAGQGPEVVMAGLAEALVATAVGIMVALPCVASYNYIQKKIKDILLDADQFGKQFILSIADKNS